MKLLSKHVIRKTNVYSKRFIKIVKRFRLALFGAVTISAFVFMLSLVMAPRNFPVGRVVTIPEGATLSEVATLFSEKGVVASPVVLKAFVALMSGDTAVRAGDYYFNEPLSVTVIAERISKGDYGLDPVRVTFSEGSTVSDMAAVLSTKLPEFDASRFIELAQTHEGYLFPDTYFFAPNIKEEDIIKEMMKTFDDKIASIQESVNNSGRSLEDIVVMASIIEKEAWKEKDRYLISGVLWNRLNIGMPLQVDATFLYINGKNTYNLTQDDLAIDSPYNTYRYKGLPPGPICNPSLSSLEAAAVPEKSKYLFYLADQNGNTYYSQNFEEHKKNKRLYIN